MASEVTIVNNALSKIGAKRIIAFTDDNKQGRLATDTYASIRDELLRNHPWNFAIRRASIPADATAPEWEFENRYALPEGDEKCLRVLEVEDEDENTGKWKVENRFILTDKGSPIKVRYMAQVEQVGQMDAAFQEVLAARLAMEWAETLTRSTTLTQNMSNLYDRKLAEARSIDGQEEIPVQLEACEWINSRL